MGSGKLSATSSNTHNASSSKLPVALRALRHRNFQLFVSGQLVSLDRKSTRLNSSHRL